MVDTLLVLATILACMYYSVDGFFISFLFTCIVDKSCVVSAGCTLCVQTLLKILYIYIYIHKIVMLLELENLHWSEI
jgi:hypothetical protein